jgi:hypothetical protein
VRPLEFAVHTAQPAPRPRHTHSVRARVWCVALAAALLAAASSASSALADQPKTKDAPGKSGPQPAIRLPVAGLGYQPQSPAYMAARLSTSSLDFIDQDHLLLTFRTAGLLKRIPGDPPDDEDQTIRAVVLEVSSGKALRSVDWRMHDHDHYLWSLQNGSFLVRQRDSLFVTDGGLELRPYLELPSRFENLEVSPDGKLLVLQIDQERHSEEEHKRLVQEALDLGTSPPREDVKILMMRSDNGEVLASSHAMRPVIIPILPNGFLETTAAKAGHWQLRYVPFGSEARVFGDVASTCAPSEFPATAAVSLIVTCVERTTDHLVQGIDSNGKLLWQFWWESTLIWPSIGGSRDGSSFAFSTLRATHPVGALEPVEAEDVKGQHVQVLDAASGVPVLTVNVAPATASDGNYALSPDGKRLAILSGTEVDVYDVPTPIIPPAAKKKK